MDNPNWKEIRQRMFVLTENLSEIHGKADRVEGLGWVIAYEKGIRENDGAIMGIAEGIETYGEHIGVLAHQALDIVSDLAKLLSNQCQTNAGAVLQ